MSEIDALVRTVKDALNTLTDVSLKEDVDDAALHEDSLNGYAALTALAERAKEAAVIDQLREGYYVDAQQQRERAEAAEAAVERLLETLAEIVGQDVASARDALSDIPADLHGPCDESPPLFSQGGVAE